jgi:thiamine transport system ATP-binding protein
MIDFTNGKYSIPNFSLAIDLAVPRGKFCAVLGPSGAGKSTLLSVIAGFENLSVGTLELAGRDMEHMPPSQRPVSMVFQDHNVFSHLDVWSNVALGISPALKLSDAQKTRVQAALDQVGIAHLAGRKPDAVSGGERQRIALARVLVRNKPILLLDEPFAALDPGLRLDMLDLVENLQKQNELTVLMVTHLPEDAKHAASDIIFIDEGVVGQPVSVANFFGSADPAIAKYIGKRH